MNRTVQYEIITERISELRNRVYDLTTVARAYEDYSEDILKIATKGSLADWVAEDLSDYAKKKAEICRLSADSMRNTADELEYNSLR